MKEYIGTYTCIKTENAQEQDGFGNKMKYHFHITMECRLCQNYSRLPTQTTWMITLTIPRLILYLMSDMISDVGYSMSDV